MSMHPGAHIAPPARRERLVTGRVRIERHRPTLSNPANGLWDVWIVTEEGDEFIVGEEPSFAEAAAYVNDGRAVTEAVRLGFLRPERRATYVLTKMLDRMPWEAA